MPKEEVETGEALTNIQEEMKSLRKPGREQERDVQRSTVLPLLAI